MKKIVCEMCGGTDLLKEDGVFVCQSCGMKYSLEEAKKMMIEGTVDVQGTVKVDNSAFVERYLQNARRAKEKEDWEETEKYYNMVEQNEPTNIEAIFYSAYGKARSSLVVADLYKRQSAFKVLQNCVSIIDDKYSLEKEEQKKILEQISADIIGMARSIYVYNESKNGYGIVVSSDKMETVTLFNNLGKEFMISLEHIAQKYSDDQKEKRVYFYNVALEHAKFILKYGSLADPTGFQNVINTYKNWIAEITAEVAVKVRQKYWTEHAEEKSALEKEKAEIEAKIAALNSEKEAVLGLTEKKSLEEKIAKLQAEKDALGMFKGKEKKEKQAEIDVINGQVANHNKSIQSAIDELQTKIGGLKKRISGIDEELARDHL